MSSSTDDVPLPRAQILLSGAFAIYLVCTVVFDLYEFQTRHRSTASAIGLAPSSPSDSDVEGGSAERRIGGGIGQGPSAFAALVAPLIALVRGGERGDAHERRAEAAPYEALPLRTPATGGGRDSVGGFELDERDGSSGSGSGSGRAARRSDGAGSGSQETVFSLGDEVEGEEDEDDGSDAYWAREEKAQRSSRRL